VRRIVAPALVAVTAFRWAPAAAAVFPTAADLFGIPTRIDGGRGVLLTFDDGPHPDGTPAVLDALEREGARALFFVSGEQVARHPSVVREVLAAGHELGLHGYRHKSRMQWTRRLVLEDTARAVDAVASATGSSPDVYRPPHGVFTRPGLKAIRSLGLEPLLWSRWGRDWERRSTPASVTRRVATALEPGDILLLHDADHYSADGSWRSTAAALPAILETIRGAGLELLTWRSRGGQRKGGPPPRPPFSAGSPQQG
jgi:peptidoglycan/xylan/chitin deacetylase (PgdA/CDA1 family)